MIEVRKLLTKKEQQKKTQRNQILIGIILIGLMLLSTAGYALSGKESNTGTSASKINYKGIDFIQNSGYWQFQKDGLQYATRFNPQNTEGLKVLGFLKLEEYKSKPLYFVGENNDAIFELNRNLNDKALRVQKACLSGENCTDNFPVKECSENIIILKEPRDESESVYRINNCVYVVANISEQVKYSDALLFKILGI